MEAIPCGQLVDDVLAQLEREFTAAVNSVGRMGMLDAGLNPVEGWKLDQAGRRFVRLRAETDAQRVQLEAEIQARANEVEFAANELLRKAAATPGA